MAELEVPNPDEIHERGETAFGRRAALTTAIYAIVLSIASLGGNNTVKEMLLSQQQSSDQWSFYQAKVIREHQYRAQKMLLEMQLAEPSAPQWPSSPPRARCSRFSLVLAVLGVLLAVNGFVPLFSLPFLHHH